MSACLGAWIEDANDDMSGITRARGISQFAVDTGRVV